jgi:hypothetical protein
VKRHFRIPVGLLAVTAGAIVLGSCELGLGEPSGTGVIEVTAASPHGPDGAAVLELTGAVGHSIVSSQFGDTFYEHDGAVTRVVVVLDEPGPIKFTLRVEDLGARPSVTLVQVADGLNRLRSSLADYEVVLRFTEDLTSSQQRWQP